MFIPCTSLAGASVTRFTRHLFPLTLGLHFACRSPEKAASVETFSEETSSEEMSEEEDACGQAPWGNIEDAAVWVDAAAETGGDGNIDAPFQTISEGIEAASALGGGRVAVAAGSYRENIDLRIRGAGVEIVGRCRELVEILGDEEDVAERDPVVDVFSRVAGATFGLQDLTLAGDYIGLRLDGGVLTASRVAIARAGAIGVVVAGSNAVLVADDLRVSGVESVRGTEGPCGVGVFEGATFEVQGLEVEDSTGIGLLSSDSTTSARGCLLRALGASGRSDAAGVIVQGGELTLSDCEIEDVEGYALGAAYGAALRVSDTTVTGLGERGAEERGQCAYIDNSTFVLEQATLQSCSLTALWAVDSDLTMREVEVRDACTTCLGLEDLDLEGVGVLLSDSTALIEDTDLIDDEEGGIYAENSTLTLREVRVEGTVDLGGGDSYGILARDSTLEADGLALADNATYGLLVEGASVATIRDASITGTFAPGGEGGASAALVRFGAQLSLLDSILTENQEISLGAIGADLSIEHVTVRDTIPSADGWGLALYVATWDEEGVRGSVVAHSSELLGSHIIGVSLDGADAELVEVRIADVEPTADGEAGYGLQASASTALVAQRLDIEDAFGIGMYLSSDSQAALEDLRIRDIDQSGDLALAFGLALSRADATAAGLDIQSIEGVGVSVSRGGLNCSACLVQDVAFAGILALDLSSLYLGPGSVVSDVEVSSLSGGVGVATLGEGYPVSLDLDGVTIGGAPLAAVYLDGPGSYEIYDSLLSAGTASGGEAIFPFENAVFAANRVEAWDGEQGLLLQGNTLGHAGGGALFLDDSSATLSGNLWQSNAIDLIQQHCVETTSEPEGSEEATTSSLCGEEVHDRRVELIEFYLTIPEYGFEG